VGTAHCVPVIGGGDMDAMRKRVKRGHLRGMVTISLACHGEGAVPAVETEVAPTGHCHELTIPGSRLAGCAPSK
jgi:hypothetical protein